MALGALWGSVSRVTDVVVLGGDAARVAAADFALGPGAGPSDRHWLAVASQAGRVVGVALARDGRPGLEITDLLTSELCDRDQVGEVLISALGPLARGRAIRVPGGCTGILGLRERRN
jgi:hypothetical protein